MRGTVLFGSYGTKYKITWFHIWNNMKEMDVMAPCMNLTHSHSAIQENSLESSWGSCNE